MRVLHLISSGGMYGAEAVILQISRQMKVDQVGESLIGVFAHVNRSVPELHEASLRAGVACHSLGCRGQLDRAVPEALRQLVEKLKVDVIHTHGYKADIYTYFAFRGRSRPALVSTCHTWYDNDFAVRLYGVVDRWLLRYFDAIVAVSEEVRKRLRQAGVPERHLFLIPNGIAVPVLDSVAFPDQVAPSLKLRVGLVGRLAPEKGIDDFIRVAGHLAPRFPQVDFLIAGEGPERPRLEELVRHQDLATRIRLLGVQSDMPAFYQSLDLLVSTSRQEGLPMALLEGMGFALPVVATSVGEIPRVVLHEETGLLVPPDAPEKVAQAAERLLKDPLLRRKYGVAGRKRVEEFFSAKRMTQEYLSLYRGALETTKQRLQESPA